MSQINPLSPTTTGELFSTGTSSVQLMFAQLQLQLSQANKNSAMLKAKKRFLFITTTPKEYRLVLPLYFT